MDCADGIAQICVSAPGNHEFKPGLVKRAVNGFPNEVDRERTPVASTGSCSIFWRISLKISSLRCSTALAKQILLSRKVVELSAAR
jgi:hypothetical protein